MTLMLRWVAVGEMFMAMMMMMMIGELSGVVQTPELGMKASRLIKDSLDELKSLSSLTTLDYLVFLSIFCEALMKMRCLRCPDADEMFAMP